MPKFPYDLSAENRNHGDSPGPVDDQETLVRVWHHPESFTDAGELSPSAISKRDLCERGLSLNRKSILDPDVQINLVKSQQERIPEKRMDAFISETLCEEIRSLTNDDGDRLCLVLDEPLDINIAHCGIYSVRKTSAEIEKDRVLLAEIFQSSLEEWDTPSQ